MYSNQVKVEVFDPVRLVPEDLLIFPGGRWTIQLKGGPTGITRSNINTSYKMDNEEIATIDSFGEVLGKKVGDTFITIKMQFENDQQNYELATETAKVRVRLITDIVIPVMNNRELYIDSVSRLNVKMRHNTETFLMAIGPLSFNWQTS